MIGHHDKPVFVFSKHVTLQHPQHCGSCAFDDCHACKECGTDREQEDRVLWREREVQGVIDISHTSTGNYRISAIGEAMIGLAPVDTVDYSTNLRVCGDTLKTSSS